MSAFEWIVCVGALAGLLLILGCCQVAGEADRLIADAMDRLRALEGVGEDADAVEWTWPT